MSWFHKDHGGKVHPILKHADYTVILGAEVADGKLTKLCYTGHASDLSTKGVLQAIVPGGNLLWRTEFAEEYDVRDGHVAVDNQIVVTRQKDGSGHVVVGHELWSGSERWRLKVPQMVSRMGVTGDGKLVFVTFDHAVHRIEIASGTDTPGEPVMTDQARDQVVNSTSHPTATWGSGNRESASKDWSGAQSYGGVVVYERDWAGTREFGIGRDGHAHIIGSGSHDGGLFVGDIVVLGFRLGSDDGHHHHWYLCSKDGAILAILREDGKSELFERGQSVWKGKL